MAYILEEACRPYQCRAALDAVSLVSHIARGIPGTFYYR